MSVAELECLKEYEYGVLKVKTKGCTDGFGYTVYY